MTSTGRPPLDAVEPAGGVPAMPPQRTADELAELRRLLVGAERDEIDRINARLEEMGLTVDELSELLPAAIETRNARDDRLGQALSPTIEHSLRASVQRNPHALVDAIFPVMGPAIRKAIAEAMSGLIQSLNTAIEHSLSWRGLKWRWEAIRAGESFATVVLRHTLLFKVDQVFLFHRETGLLLCEVIDQEALQQDPDLVSAMATALKDFARDSFHTGEAEDLSVFKIGEQVVLVEQGPRAILMALVKGHTPNEVRTVLQDVLEGIHREFSVELDAFEGDAAPFEAAKPSLERAMQMRVADQDKRGISPVFGVGVTVVGLLIALWGFLAIRTERRWNRLVADVHAEPGVVVVDAVRDDGEFRISGLRDPSATDLSAHVARSKLAPESVVMSWEPYVSLDSTIVSRRAEAVLGRATVSYVIGRDTLYAVGEASNEWITRARAVAPTLPGVVTLDVSQLVDLDLRALRGLADSIEDARVTFAVGSAQLTSDQRQVLADVGVKVQALVSRAVELGHVAVVELIGRADSVGAESRNLPLSEARATVVRDVLRASVPQGVYEVRGLGSTNPLATAAGEQAINRSVSFRIRLRPATDEPS